METLNALSASSILFKHNDIHLSTVRLGCWVSQSGGECPYNREEFIQALRQLGQRIIMDFPNIFISSIFDEY